MRAFTTQQGLFGSSPLPVVQFADGSTHTVGPHNWTTTDNKATFRQIPLILAFALTIHKIQGATLDCARIDAGRTLFEGNQMYVALSRLRTVEGLYLTDFDASRVLVHPDAVRFYAELEAAQAEQRAHESTMPAATTTGDHQQTREVLQAQAFLQSGHAE